MQSSISSDDRSGHLQLIDALTDAASDPQRIRVAVRQIQVELPNTPSESA